MLQILLASNNPGKLLELQALLLSPTGRRPRFAVLSPLQLGIDLDVSEDGQTYAENAALKALAYARAAQSHPALAARGGRVIVLADDSGLEVDALGGAPGLHSARYTGLAQAAEAAKRPGDAERRAFLLHALAESGAPRPWTAHFHCTVALVGVSFQPASLGKPVFTTGDCPGEIIPEERGSNGFGYDPIFFIPALGRTMAELSMEEKNALSHRALAVKAALPYLK